VDPSAGLDDVKKRKFLNLPGLQLQPFDLPPRSQSLYRLRYPGSVFGGINIYFILDYGILQSDSVQSARYWHVNLTIYGICIGN
jgi:hypothetical protein